MIALGPNVVECLGKQDKGLVASQHTCRVLCGYLAERGMMMTINNDCGSGICCQTISDSPSTSSPESHWGPRCF